MSNYYKWHLRDATGNHCGACRSRNGKTKSGEEWDLIGAPPVHRHCGCSLELVHSDDEETEEDVVPDGAGTHDHESPTDPQPDDETPEYPPDTPGGSTPPKPPPPPKCARCGGPHLTKFCPDKRR